MAAAVAQARLDNGAAGEGVAEVADQALESARLSKRERGDQCRCRPAGQRGEQADARDEPEAEKDHQQYTQVGEQQPIGINLPAPQADEDDAKAYREIEGEDGDEAASRLKVRSRESCFVAVKPRLQEFLPKPCALPGSIVPSAAALFVALRSGLEVLDLLAAARARGADFSVATPFREQIVPGVAGNLLAVVVLTLASGLFVLAVAYLVSYGVTPWGLTDYTRLVGQVFDPVTAPTLLLKIVLFGIAVAVAPVTVVLDPPRRAASGSEMRVMVRLLLLLVAIEGATLVLLHF